MVLGGVNIRLPLRQVQFLAMLLAVVFLTTERNVRGQDSLEKPDLDQLIAGLKSEDKEKRLAAIEDIESYNLMHERATAAIVPLQKLLEDDESIAVRIAAASTLFELDQPAETLIQPAIDGLRDSQEENRIDATYLLLKLDRAAEPAIDDLCTALNDDEEDVRANAAIVLGKLGPDSKTKTAPLLIDLLEDQSTYVRLCAAEALANVDGPLDRAVSTLIAIIQDYNEQDSEDFGLASNAIQCVDVLGDLGVDGAAAIPVLTEALQLGGIYRQTATAEALGKMGSQAESSVDVLGQALLEGEVHGMPFVHHTWCASDDAATALALIGEKSVPVLLAALTDSEERVRANAAIALGDIPSAARETVPEIAKLLDDEAAPVRANAAWALGKIGPAAKETVPELVKLLFDHSEWDSAPAGGGIATSYSVPWHASEAINRIKPGEEVLIEALNSSLEEYKTINFSVASVIETVGPKAKVLIEPLEEMLDDEELSSAAGYALASIDPELDGLRVALEKSLIDSKGEIDRVAARGLRLMGKFSKESISKLYQTIEVALQSEFVGGCSDMIECSLAILYVDPADEFAIDNLLLGLQESHPYFDEYSVQEAERLLPGLLDESELLREKWLAQLQDDSDDLHENEVSLNRLRVAKVLSSTPYSTADSIKTLDRLIARGGRYSLRAEAATVLGLYGEKAKSSVPVLIQFLGQEDEYIVGGDFHGNGGEAIVVGDKIVQSLANIGPVSIPFLIDKLDSTNHIVRTNAVKALGMIGDDAELVLQSLCDLTGDPSHLVRREVAIALQRILGDEIDQNQQSKAALNRLAKDRRPSVAQAVR